MTPEEMRAASRILAASAPPFSEAQKLRLRALIVAARTTARLRTAA